ncbi:MAG: SlyX family protein [Phycisphaerales bacterium]
MTQDHVDARVTRLEESALFADRAVDALNEAIREVTGAIDRLSRRIEALESRLEEVAEESQRGDPGLEPPPHSAGPDIPRDPL